RGGVGTTRTADLGLIDHHNPVAVGQPGRQQRGFTGACHTGDGGEYPGWDIHGYVMQVVLVDVLNGQLAGGLPERRFDARPVVQTVAGDRARGVQAGQIAFVHHVAAVGTSRRPHIDDVI